MGSNTLPSAHIEVDSPEAHIGQFVDRYGEAHLRLLCHAAFPLSLTPDLLYRLWISLQKDDRGQNSYIPWTAVSDILLSSFFEEVGHNLYELKPTIRNELLRRLGDDPRFGKPRIKELSKFTLAYAESCLHNAESPEPNFARTLRLGAIAHTQSQVAARELAESLNHAYQNDVSDLNRVAEIVQRLANPLANYPVLLDYARGMARYARGDKVGATEYFQKIFGSSHASSIEGISLSIPEDLLLTISEFDKPRLSPLKGVFGYCTVVLTLLFVVVARPMWFEWVRDRSLQPSSESTLPNPAPQPSSESTIPESTLPNPAPQPSSESTFPESTLPNPPQPSSESTLPNPAPPQPSSESTLPNPPQPSSESTLPESTLPESTLPNPAPQPSNPLASIDSEEDSVDQSTRISDEIAQANNLIAQSSAVINGQDLQLTTEQNPSEGGSSSGFFATSQSRLMSLSARNSDLELQGQLINQSRLQLANMVGALFQRTADLDPDSEAAQRLVDQIESIQEMDKSLELQSNRLAIQRTATRSEMESVQRTISENIKTSFEPFDGEPESVSSGPTSEGESQATVDFTALQSLVQRTQEQLNNIRTDITLLEADYAVIELSESGSRNNDLVGISQKLGELNQSYSLTEMGVETSMRQAINIRERAIRQEDLERLDGFNSLLEELAAELATLRGRRDSLQQRIP